MQKWLAIVCLLVLVGIAAGQNPSSDSPKQEIAEQETSKKGQEQPQSQPHNQAAPNLAASTVQPPAPTHDESTEASRENLQIQRWLMYFTGGLVGVGFLQLVLIGWQAILLRRTREDVHTQAGWMEAQAGHMEKQTGVLEKSVAAAQTSADAARDQIKIVKQKERAKLAVSRPRPIERLDTEVFEVNYVTVAIENIGYTNALNVSLRANSDITESSAPCVFARLPQVPISNVIRNGLEATITDVMLIVVTAIEKKDPSKPGLFIHVQGILEYEDVFESPHSTTFRYVMEIDRIAVPDPAKEIVKIVSRDGWQICGAKEDNLAT